MPEARGRISGLAVRSLSACLFVPTILLLVEGGIWSLLILVLIVVGRGSWEFFHMARQAGRRPLAFLGTGLALSLSLCAYAAGTDYLLPAIAAVLLVILAAALLRGTRDYIANTLLTLGGTLYLGLLGSAPLLILAAAGPDQHREAQHLLVSLFACIWLTDSAAYICGHLWGRRKLVPSISPGKTVVGFVSGIGGGLLPVLGAPFLPSFTIAELFGLLLLASIGGQLGDLVESAIKRDLGVKDAPPLIPGHGGILDRFDSYLFAFPLAYLYILTLDIF
jgi:phosphatidate cytidylyltransferase